MTENTIKFIIFFILIIIPFSWKINYIGYKHLIMDKKTELTVDELLQLGNKRIKEELKDIESEEYENQTETVDNVIKEISAIREQTNLKKQMFINELKNGLADDIKTNRGVRLIKKSRFELFITAIKRFFLKF